MRMYQMFSSERSHYYYSQILYYVTWGELIDVVLSMFKLHIFGCVELFGLLLLFVFLLLISALSNYWKLTWLSISKFETDFIARMEALLVSFPSDFCAVVGYLSSYFHHLDGMCQDRDTPLLRIEWCTICDTSRIDEKHYRQ